MSVARSYRIGPSVGGGPHCLISEQAAFDGTLIGGRPHSPSVGFAPAAPATCSTSPPWFLVTGGRHWLPPSSSPIRSHSTTPRPSERGEARRHVCNMLALTAI